MRDDCGLRTVISGLVVIDESTNKVRLAHYSIVEYLENRKELLGDSELLIATACLTYLSFDVFTDLGPTRSWSERCARIKKYPFSDYAAVHLRSHLGCCNEFETSSILHEFFDRYYNVYYFFDIVFLDNRRAYTRYYGQWDILQNGTLEGDKIWRTHHTDVSSNHVIILENTRVLKSNWQLASELKILIATALGHKKATEKLIWGNSDEDIDYSTFDLKSPRLNELHKRAVSNSATFRNPGWAFGSQHGTPELSSESLPVPAPRPIHTDPTRHRLEPVQILSESFNAYGNYSPGGS